MTDETSPLIGYYVHGRGRGHAARARTVLPALLDAGYRVTVASGGDALEWLEPIADVRPIEIIQPGRASPARWRERVVGDCGELSRLGVRVVVTDGDGPSLVAGRVMRLPTVAIGHGLVFGHAKLPNLPFWPRVREALNAGSSSYLAHRRIGVHFLPTSPRDATTIMARPDFPDEFTAAPAEPWALAYFRDNNGLGLLNVLVDHLDTLGIERVRCFGARPSPGVRVPDEVEFLPMDPDAFRMLLPRAKVVIGSAGSNLISECVHLQKPLLCQYSAQDAEQVMNARLAEDAGVAIGVERGSDYAPVARFAERVAGNGFEKVALSAALPPVSQAVVSALQSLLADS